MSMAVMPLPPEAPRSVFRRRGWRQGCVARQNDGFAWYATRNGVKYRGPQVATRELAEAALGEALEAFDRGEMPVTAPPRMAPGHPRSKTVPPEQLRRELRSVALVLYPDDVKRPRERADCAPCPTCQDWRDNQTGDDQERLACGHTPVEAIARSRPCLFVGCESNNYLEVNEATGSIKFMFPHLEPGQMKDSCAEDLIDEGGVTLERAGAALGVTRERARQIEVKGIHAIEESRESAGLSPPHDRTVYPPGGKGPRSGCP